MTEHVHEYCFSVTLLSQMVERLRDPVIVKCDHCDHTLNEAEILTRLNEYETLKAATERLSVGCFNCKKTIQETYLKQFPSGDYTCRDCDIAYADKLEGK